MLLTVTKNTVFKDKPAQSSELKDTEKESVLIGSYELKDADDMGDHLCIELVNPIGGKTKWYVYKGHIEQLNVDQYPANKDEPAPKQAGPFKIPGFSQVLYLTESVISGGHFTWSEATKGGQRIPSTRAIGDNIIRVAHKLEDVRHLFGDRSISVNSWYRDPASNRQVGGASQSTHMNGHAVDINIDGYSPRQVQQKLESVWAGGMGYGSNFTHLDMRDYKARWNYGS